jgi:hypothetical protein
MLTDYQRQQLERLFRNAVWLAVNPAGSAAPCEMACGRLGRDAHHAVHRSQEPGLRLKYEPRFAALLCPDCHKLAHRTPNAFLAQLLAALARTNPRKAKCLSLYAERHDRMRPPKVTFAWLMSYLREYIARRERRWSDAYNQDVVYGDFA